MEIEFLELLLNRQPDLPATTKSYFVMVVTLNKNFSLQRNTTHSALTLTIPRCVLCAIFGHIVTF